MNIKTLAIVAGLSMMSISAQAKLQEIGFHFRSTTGGIVANGDFFVTGSEITNITGNITGTGFGNQSINGIVSNVNFPGISYSPDGVFYYNNFYSQHAPYLDLGGVLFTTSNNNGYWNLFGTGGNGYNLDASTNGYLSMQVPGVLTTSVPETSTWLMLLLGFLGIGYVGKHNSRRRLVE